MRSKVECDACSAPRKVTFSSSSSISSSCLLLVLTVFLLLNKSLAWGIMTTTSHGCFVSFEKKKMTIRFFNLDQIRKFHLRQSNLQANYKNLCYLTTRHHLKMHCVWSLMGFWPRRIVSVSMTFLHHSGDCLKLSTKQFDLRRCRGYGDKLGFAPPLAPALQFAPQAWSPPLQTRCDMCCQSKVTFGSCTAPIWTPVWHGPLCDQNRQSASARIQSTGWKHVICKHFVCICTSMFQHGFWWDICGSALNFTNCLACTVFAQWGTAKKLQKHPLYKSPPLSRSKIERMSTLNLANWAHCQLEEQKDILVVSGTNQFPSNCEQCKCCCWFL